MSNDTDITTIPDADLWLELIRRTADRERTGEASIWPKVTVVPSMGSAGPPAEIDPAYDVIVSWSGKRHYRLAGCRTQSDGSARALCSDSTYGKPTSMDDHLVMWGTKHGHTEESLPMCKSCLRSAAAGVSR